MVQEMHYILIVKEIILDLIYLMADRVRKGFEDLEKYEWYQETLQSVYGPNGLVKNRYLPSYGTLADPGKYGQGAGGITGGSSTVFGNN